MSPCSVSKGAVIVEAVITTIQIGATILVLALLTGCIHNESSLVYENGVERESPSIHWALKYHQGDARCRADTIAKLCSHLHGRRSYSKLVAARCMYDLLETSDIGAHMTADCLQSFCENVIQLGPRPRQRHTFTEVDTTLGEIAISPICAIDVDGCWHQLSNRLPRGWSVQSVAVTIDDGRSTVLASGKR